MSWPERYDGPVENHPATARLREHIRHLELLPQTPERDQALEYARAEVRRFNASEYDARARTYMIVHPKVAGAMSDAQTGEPYYTADPHTESGARDEKMFAS